MKSLLLATTAVLMLSGAALAADLPVTKGPAPAPAPVASTDGFDFAFGGKLMSDYIS